MRRYQILVTGARDYDNYGNVSYGLDQLVAAIGSPPYQVIHGAAPGADALASRWAYEHKIDVDAYGAKWGAHGNAAGPLRNEVMAGRLRIKDLVAAFPTDRSRGTWDMVRKAQALGVLVYVWDDVDKTMRPARPA